MAGKKIKKFKFKTTHMKKFVDITFVILISVYAALAVFKLSDPLVWERKVTKFVGPIMSVPVTKLPPTEVKIDAIHLDLPVAAGLASGNTWDLYDDKIAWLATSSIPGEGNVILY